MNRALTVAALLLSALRFEAYSQEGLNETLSTWRVELAIGRHISAGTFNDFFGLADWRHKYTVRLGVGRDIQEHITASAFAEYRRYTSETTYGDMFPSRFFRSYSRTEIACYVSTTFYGFLEGGIGAVYQSHEEISSYRPIYEIPIYQVQIQPAAQRTKLFYLVGLKYEIPLGARFYLPVAVSMDMFLGHYDIQEPTIKLGLVKQFN